MARDYEYLAIRRHLGLSPCLSSVSKFNPSEKSCIAVFSVSLTSKSRLRLGPNYVANS